MYSMSALMNAESNQPSDQVYDSNYKRISPAEIIRQEYGGSAQAVSRILDSHTQKEIELRTEAKTQQSYQKPLLEDDSVDTSLDVHVQKHIKSSQFNNLKWDDLLPATPSLRELSLMKNGQSPQQIQQQQPVQQQQQQQQQQQPVQQQQQQQQVYNQAVPPQYQQVPFPSQQQQQYIPQSHQQALSYANPNHMTAPTEQDNNQNEMSYVQQMMSSAQYNMRGGNDQNQQSPPQAASQYAPSGSQNYPPVQHHHLAPPPPPSHMNNTNYQNQYDNDAARRSQTNPLMSPVGHAAAPPSIHGTTSSMDDSRFDNVSTTLTYGTSLNADVNANQGLEAAGESKGIVNVTREENGMSYPGPQYQHGPQSFPTSSHGGSQGDKAFRESYNEHHPPHTTSVPPPPPPPPLPTREVHQSTLSPTPTITSNTAPSSLTSDNNTAVHSDNIQARERLSSYGSEGVGSALLPPARVSQSLAPPPRSNVASLVSSGRDSADEGLSSAPDQERGRSHIPPPRASISMSGRPQYRQRMYDDETADRQEVSHGEKEEARVLRHREREERQPNHLKMSLQALRESNMAVWKEAEMKAANAARALNTSTATAYSSRSQNNVRGVGGASDSEDSESYSGQEDRKTNRKNMFKTYDSVLGRNQSKLASKSNNLFTNPNAIASTFGVSFRSTVNSTTSNDFGNSKKMEKEVLFGDRGLDRSRSAKPSEGVGYGMSSSGELRDELATSDSAQRAYQWLASRYLFAPKVEESNTKLWRVELVSILKRSFPNTYRNGDQLIWSPKSDNEEQQRIDHPITFIEYCTTSNGQNYDKSYSDPGHHDDDDLTVYCRVSFGNGNEVKEVPLSEVSKRMEIFSNGDLVTWIGGFDDGVPKGEVGEVLGYNERGRVRVKFPRGSWNFLPQELRKEADKGISNEALHVMEKVVCEVLGRVLTTAALVAAPHSTNTAHFIQALHMCIPSDMVEALIYAFHSAASKNSDSSNISVESVSCFIQQFMTLSNKSQFKEQKESEKDSQFNENKDQNMSSRQEEGENNTDSQSASGTKNLMIGVGDCAGFAAILDALVDKMFNNAVQFARLDDPREGSVIQVGHLEKAVSGELGELFPLGLQGLLSLNTGTYNQAGNASQDGGGVSTSENGKSSVLFDDSHNQPSNRGEANHASMQRNETNQTSKTAFQGQFEEKGSHVETSSKGKDQHSDVLPSDKNREIENEKKETPQFELSPEIESAQNILSDKFKEAGLHKDYRALNDLKSRMKTVESLKVEAKTIGQNLKKAEEREDYELCEVISSRLNEIDKQILNLVETSPTIRASTAFTPSVSTYDALNTETMSNNATSGLGLNSQTSSLDGAGARVLALSTGKMMSSLSANPPPPAPIDVDHAPGGLTRESILAMFETAKGNREYKKMKILKLMTFQLDEVRLQLGEMKAKLVKLEEQEDFEKCEVIAAKIAEKEALSHDRTIENMKQLEELNKIKLQQGQTDADRDPLSGDDERDGGYSSTQWGVPIRNTFGEHLLLHFETSYKESKEAQVKDYAYLKSLKQQIESQKILNEKANLLYAELSHAEQAQDFDKCCAIEVKLKEIPKTIAEAKVHQRERMQKAQQTISGGGQEVAQDGGLQGRVSGRGSEMLMRMQRDMAMHAPVLTSSDRVRGNRSLQDGDDNDRVISSSMNSGGRGGTHSHANRNNQSRSAPRNNYDSSSERGSESGVGRYGGGSSQGGRSDTRQPDTREGQALLSRLEEFISRVALEELRVESIERKQISYSVGDRVVLTLSDDLTRPKGEVVYGEDDSGCYSVRLDDGEARGAGSGRRSIRKSKRVTSPGRDSDSEGGLADDDGSSLNDGGASPVGQKKASAEHEYRTVHASQMSLLSTPMDELVAMVAVAAHSGKVPPRTISEAKTILRDLVVREQAASDEKDAWDELDAEERRLIRKERNERYGGVNLGGGDRSSKARVNARIISKGGGGNAGSGGGGMATSRSLQRHLHGRQSLSSPRSSRSSSPRLNPQSNLISANNQPLQDADIGTGVITTSRGLKRSDSSRSYNSQSAPRSSNLNHQSTSNGRNSVNSSNTKNIINISKVTGGNSKINEFLSELDDDQEEIHQNSYNRRGVAVRNSGRGHGGFEHQDISDGEGNGGGYGSAGSSNRENHRNNRSAGNYSQKVTSSRSSNRRREGGGGDVGGVKERSYYSNFASDVATGRRSRENM